MSRLAIFTSRAPAAPLPLDPEATAARLVVGDPPRGAPKCDRCGEPASVELEHDPRLPQRYCVPCLVDLVGFGAGLELEPLHRRSGLDVDEVDALVELVNELDRNLDRGARGVLHDGPRLVAALKAELARWRVS